MFTNINFKLKMVEKNIIINNRTLSHEGIFRIDELFKTINDSLEKLGYTKVEKKTEETVFPTGKKSYIELRPYKVRTSLVTFMIKIKISLENMKEVVKQVDGINRAFQEGKAKVVFDSWLVTDHASRWGMKPWFYFLKRWIGKWFYHLPAHDDFAGELGGDTGYIDDQIRSLFSLYKFQVG